MIILLYDYTGWAEKKNKTKQKQGTKNDQDWRNVTKIWKLHRMEVEFFISQLLCKQD